MGTRDNQALLALSLARRDDLYLNDLQISALRPSPAVTEKLQRCATTIEAVALLCECYSHRAALGRRNLSSESAQGEGELLESFQTMTYGELWKRSQRLASGWQKSTEPLVKAGDLVGIIGFPSPEYVVADMACLYLNAAANSLATDFSQAELEQIINEGSFSCVVASWESLNKIIQVLPLCPSVKSVAVFNLPANLDSAAQKLRRIASDFKAQGRTVLVQSLAEIEAWGVEKGLVPFVIPKDGNDLRMLCYTSGSTGFPKGAIFPESLMHKYWTTPFMGTAGEIPQVVVSFSPFNHIMGRFGLIRVLSQGGTLNFASKSDMSTLFADMRIAQPTQLDLVPRVAEMIFQHFQTELVRRGRVEKDTEALKAQVMKEMRQGFLGSRLLYASIGSAPTSLEVKRFIMDCFEIPLFEMYGMTEVGPVIIEEKIAEAFIPDYKMVDVPELGYRLSDQPYPRGMLCLKSNLAVAGYYKNEKASQELFDSEGFLRTGDIFEKRPGDRLVYIDREKNVLKLSQGEFVTIWRLESLFENASPVIKQVYLYGNSSRAYLVGVIVPNREYLEHHFANLGKTFTDADVVQLIRSEMKRIAKEESLRAYEIPRDFILESEPFTTENNLLTAIKKNARPNLKKKYAERLEALYSQMERKQLEDLAALADAGPHASGAALVSKALEATLGISGIEINSEQSFDDLGGDSLSAVAFCSMLQQLCGVSIAASFLLSPTTTLAGVVKKVESQLAGNAEEGITFESIHGRQATTIKASDLKLARFFSQNELARAQELPAAGLSTDPKNFLLTGATGWLGRFLCLELLEQAATKSGQIYALVRASDDAKALARLRSVFLTDPVLRDRFDWLASQYLVVLAGDLEKNRFGLSDDKYAMLADSVDAIIHPGALVNHVYSYPQLFQPNVLGTVEVIRLAMEKRLKAITYVSTLGVLWGAADAGVSKENLDVRALAPEWTINTAAYAQGYGISKWAGEVLLRELSDQIKIPINVFRPDMIMPHQKYRGQINVPDMFTRFLASLVYTGVAPKSFYLGDGPAHYDGLPGDFIARAMVGIAARPQSIFSTYNVTNPYLDDGISLNTIADWVRSAGYALSEVSDYEQWFQLFKNRVEALDDVRKGYSSLPILHMWEHPAAAQAAVQPDVVEFQSKVRSIGDEIPHLTEGFIHKYLADMAYLKIIPSPKSKPAAIGKDMGIGSDAAI